MKARLDLHTHTIPSGHAYSTIEEMARRAANLGLQLLGITEHAPALPGTCSDIYFRNLHVVPRELYGVRLLMGAELNILDTTGRLDLSDDFCRQNLDIRIAGMHSQCWQGGTKAENTSAMVCVIENPVTHIISHPGDGTAELDFEPIVLAAKRTQTLLEINSSSMDPSRRKMMARPNNLEILRLAKKHDTPIILGSAAHIAYSIADNRYAEPLLGKPTFTMELVMNDKPDLLLEYLNL